MSTLRAPLLVLRNREIFRVELSWAASSVANWAFFVVLAVYAYEVGGAGAVGLATFVRMLPAAIGAPATALLADRHSRRGVLVVSHAVRAISVAAIALAVLGSLPLAAVLVLAAIQTVAATAERPAMASLLPTLARSPVELAAANIAVSAIDAGGFMLGSLAGGLLAALLSAQSGFAATAACFQAAALIAALVARDPVPEHREMAGANIGREALSGLRTIPARAELRLLFGLVAATTFVQGMVDVLVVAAALGLLGLGNAGVGYLNSAWGVGGVLGAVGALAMLGRGRLAPGLDLGCVLVGSALIGVAAVPAAGTAIVLLAVLGTGYALIEVASRTLLQRLVSDEMLARVFGVFESSYFATEGLGALASPLLIRALGVRGAMLVVGSLLPLLALAQWSRLARYETAAPVPEREFNLLRRISLFAPLPLATVENLARRVTGVRFASGETIVREGEPGNSFYVLADGEVQVTVAGAWRRNASAGDFFGEIALLREIPRTATVTAVAPTTVLELPREAFISALSGYPKSVQAADRVIGTRLDGSGRKDQPTE